MKEYVKSLRVATASLVLLLAFGIEVVTERARLEEAVLDIEQYAIAAALARNPRTLLPGDPGVAFEGDEDAFREASQIYFAFEDRGQLYALGQFWRRMPSRHDRQLRIAGSTTVHLTITARMEPPERAYDQALSEDRDIEWCRAQPDSDAGGQLDEIFFLPVEIASSDYAESDIVGQPFKMVVSNFTYDPDDGESGGGCVKAGKDLRVSLAEDVWPDAFMDTEQLEATALSLGRDIGIVRDDAARTYIDARVKLETGRVKLPVLGDEVGGGRALLAIAVLGVALLGWSSFLLRELAGNSLHGAEEPWGLVELLTMLRRSPWPGRIAVTIELGLLVIFHLLAIAAAVALVGLLFSTLGDSPISRVVRWPLLITVGILGWSALLGFAAVIGKAMGMVDEKQPDGIR